MYPYEDLSIFLSKLTAKLYQYHNHSLKRQVGIKYAQYKILLALDGIDKMSQTSIAKLLGQTEASISRQMRVMDGEGLIRINLHSADRRKRSVSLTKRGRRILNQSRILINTLNKEIVESCFTEDELYSFRSKLNLLTQNLIRHR